MLRFQIYVTKTFVLSGTSKVDIHIRLRFIHKYNNFLSLCIDLMEGDKMDRSWREEWKDLCLKKKRKLRHVKTQDKIMFEIFYTLSDYKKCKWCFVLKILIYV